MGRAKTGLLRAVQCDQALARLVSGRAAGFGAVVFGHGPLQEGVTALLAGDILGATPAPPAQRGPAAFRAGTLLAPELESALVTACEAAAGRQPPEPTAVTEEEQMLPTPEPPQEQRAAGGPEVGQSGGSGPSTGPLGQSAGADGGAPRPPWAQQQQQPAGGGQGQQRRGAIPTGSAHFMAYLPHASSAHEAAFAALQAQIRALQAEIKDKDALLAATNEALVAANRGLAAVATGAPTAGA